jgi:hypothetical protein
MVGTFRGVGRFVFWTFCIGTLGLGSFCRWEVLELGSFIVGNLCIGTFCIWDVFGLGRFVWNVL